MWENRAKDWEKCPKNDVGCFNNCVPYVNIDKFYPSMDGQWTLCGLG